MQLARLGIALRSFLGLVMQEEQGRPLSWLIKSYKSQELTALRSLRVVALARVCVNADADELTLMRRLSWRVDAEVGALMMVRRCGCCVSDASPMIITPTMPTTLFSPYMLRTNPQCIIIINTLVVNLLHHLICSSERVALPARTQLLF